MNLPRVSSVDSEGNEHSSVLLGLLASPFMFGVGAVMAGVAAGLEKVGNGMEVLMEDMEHHIAQTCMPECQVCARISAGWEVVIREDGDSWHITMTPP